MSLRFDKYLWCVRLAKTRTQASELISKGKVKLNQTQVKSSREVKSSDTISIHKNVAIFEFKVLEVIDKRIGAKLVENYILDVTKPEEIERHKQYLLAQSAYRDNGSGKPSKKDRRDIDDFLDF